MGTFNGVDLDELVLTSERLTLRPWQAADVAAVHETMQDPRMHEFLAVPDPYRRSDAERFVAQSGDEGRADGTGLGCAVVDRRSGELVGSAALRLPAALRHDADIGYWIAPSAQGQGYAAEATRTLAGWAFEQGLARVELRCDVRNVASARTALAAGFAFEGVRRDYIPTPTGRRALASFGRTATDPGDRIRPMFTPLPTGGLGDGVLRLRAVESGDGAALAETDDALTLSTGFTGQARPPDEVQREADRAGLDWLVGSTAPFAMVDVMSGRLAGTLRLRLAGPPQVGGIGYVVHPDFRGRGYAARALRLLVRWAFGPGGFARLELGAKTDNVASQKAALAAGFLPDGVRARRLRNADGTFSDEVRFALVRAVK